MITEMKLRRNNFTIKNIYDLIQWKNIDTKLKDLLVENALLG